jgi:hypothetical protein
MAAPWLDLPQCSTRPRPQRARSVRSRQLYCARRESGQSVATRQLPTQRNNAQSFRLRTPIGRRFCLSWENRYSDPLPRVISPRPRLGVGFLWPRSFPSTGSEGHSADRLSGMPRFSKSQTDPELRLTPYAPRVRGETPCDPVDSRSPGEVSFGHGIARISTKSTLENSVAARRTRGLGHRRHHSYRLRPELTPEDGAATAAPSLVSTPPLAGFFVRELSTRACSEPRTIRRAGDRAKFSSRWLRPEI